MRNTMTLIIAAYFAAFLSFSVNAAENPFGISNVQNDSHIAMSSEPEGKCGEGKCGGDKKKAKCGEGKCGGDKKSAKCGEGKCGGDKKSAKCGEGKCGAK